MSVAGVMDAGVLDKLFTIVPVIVPVSGVEIPVFEILVVLSEW